MSMTVTKPSTLFRRIGFKRPFATVVCALATGFCAVFIPGPVFCQETVSSGTLQEQPESVAIPDALAADDVTDGPVAGNPLDASAGPSDLIPAEPFPAQADVVHFKAGGELAGDIRLIEDGSRKKYLVVTESGSTLLLDSRTVSKVIYRDSAYASALNSMDPESADDHWKMYEWCLAQDGGKSRLRDQMSFHLQRIIELDANDDRARKAAGLEYDDTSGRWVRPEQRYAIHGYTKVTGGKYAPVLQLEIEALKAHREKLIGERRTALKDWDKDSRTDSSQAMIDRLFRIVDAPAVPLVFAMAKAESNAVKRKLFVDAIGNVSSGAAGNALIHFAVRDPDLAIRERALVLLKQEMYNPNALAMKAAHFLRDPNNDYINRAGFVIAELGSAAPTLNLIEALVTLHQPPKLGSSGGTPMNFGTDSQGGTSFGAGTPPPKGPTEKRNGSVLDALRRITGQNLQYNKAAWRRWYTENHTISQIDLRRDE